MAWKPNEVVRRSQFSNKLHRSKKGNTTDKPSKFDEKCQEYGINHRLTRPATSKTNGMVERLNGIIKSATIAKVDYQSQKEMKTELTKYLIYYNTKTQKFEERTGRPPIPNPRKMV